MEEDDSLTIYGQSDQADTMGRLTASITAENATIWDAAIGGNGSKDGGMDGGAVTIHGGFVSAMATLIDEDESTGGNDDESTGGNDEVSTHYAHGAAIGGAAVAALPLMVNRLLPTAEMAELSSSMAA